MECKIACKICNYFLSKRIINADLYDVYIYGSELLLSFLISVLLIIFLGAISGDILLTVVYLIVFIAVRRFTGGYHADTYLKCKLITIGTYALTLGLSKTIDITVPCYFVLFVCGIAAIFKFGPIENPNKPLVEEEKKKLKYIAIALFAINTVSGIIALKPYQRLSNMIFFTLVSIVLLMLIAMLKKEN